MTGRALRIIGVIAVAGWFVLLRPQSLGGPAAWILVAGDSMEPTIHQGSLVIVMSRSSYEIGDVVAYRVPEGNPGAGQNVIHRIIGGGPGDGFIVRGDNTSGPDIWRPRPSEIAGAAWLTLADAALPLLWLRSPLVIASIAAGFAAYVVLGLLEPRQPRNRTRPAVASRADGSVSAGPLEG